MRTLRAFFVLFIVVASTLPTLRSQQSPQRTSSDQAKISLDGKIALPVEVAALAPRSNQCPVLHNEQPVTCNCTDNAGHHFTKQAACISCWTAGTNPQRCSTQCYACVPNLRGTTAKTREL